MLGCNAYGAYPTKFNSDLFTFDPIFVDEDTPFTPDFRKWGGGSFTAQNQRLVYWPMLKNGDYDMRKTQFDFYLRLLSNAQLCSLHYWGHEGACFTEQITNFGLPAASQYDWQWKRPKTYDAGLQYNPWIEYEWDTVFEFCLTILDVYYHTGRDISIYMPMVESCLTFFDKHYQYFALKRTTETLNADGHLVLYPGTACETYKGAYNSTSMIAALKTALSRVLQLPDKYLLPKKRKHWEKMRDRIPPISFRSEKRYKVISSASVWERIQNVELPQLYPVFPYKMYGIDKPGLQIAIDTFKYGFDNENQRSWKGWRQDGIFSARLGLREQARSITLKKMSDANKRFPAFWGPGFDWTPDHNWGGSGMIGLQEMLLQTQRDAIYLFPAWPKEWDVNFMLHALQQTIIEAEFRNGKITSLKVTPESRRQDVQIMLA